LLPSFNFGRTRFETTPDFSFATFTGETSFGGAIFRKGADFLNARMNAHLNLTDFEVNGERLMLTGAQV
jgi:hypothetical protein